MYMCNVYYGYNVALCHACFVVASSINLIIPIHVLHLFPTTTSRATSQRLGRVRHISIHQCRC